MSVYLRYSEVLLQHIQAAVKNFRPLVCMLMTITGVLLSGCITAKEMPVLMTGQDVEQIPVYIHQLRIESMQKKIEQLEQQLAKQEALIKQNSGREQDQAQLIQATSKELADKQTKIQRLATKSSTASLISEAEVAMTYIDHQSSLPIASDEQLHAQVIQLLELAVVNYQRDDYANATCYASQALEFVHMISDQKRAQPDQTTIPFNTPIFLKTKSDANLRREPGRHALIIDVLSKETVLTANAYQGNWLMVQTDKNTQGWVHNTLVEIRKVDKQP